MTKLIRVFLLLSPLVVRAQNVPIKFFEIISGDSVKLFIDSAEHFTEKHCAYFTRYTRLDKDANFNGFFKDITIDNNVLGMGHYNHGIRHGYFELYHENGKLMLKGNYENNLPVGKWEMYYNNGLPHRTIIMHEGDTLLWTLINPKGRVDVSNGNGTYVLYKEYQSRFYYFLDLKGTVKNGRPDGVWSTDWAGYRIPGRVFTLKEWFENGEFQRSNHPGRSDQKRSLLVKFLPETYLTKVEKFTMVKCYDSIHDLIQLKVNFHEKLKSHIYKTLWRMNDEKPGSLNPGVHRCVIKFLTNNEGTPSDFQLLTPFGADFLSGFIDIVKKKVKFNSFNLTIYYYFELNFESIHRYTFNTMFLSNEKTIETIIRQAEQQYKTNVNQH